MKNIIDHSSTRRLFPLLAVSLILAPGSTGADETVTGRLTVDQNSPTTALQVLGGHSGAALAVFRRDDLYNSQIHIHASGDDPQITLSDMQTGEAEAVWTLGVKKSDNSFRLVKAGAIVEGTNQFFTITQAGNVGIGTTAPAHRLHVAGSSGSGLMVSATGGSTFAIVPYSGANLADVPGSNFGMQLAGTANGHVVLDIPGNDGHDGFYVRVPSVLENNPTVDTTAFVVKANGNVGIGTTAPAHKLAVDGTIKAKEVIVETTGWPDYVFASDYRLAPLEEVEAHIKSEGHLPGIPSAREVAGQGISVGDMQARLLAKIEELTLHLIEQDRLNQTQAATIESLRADLAALKVALAPVDAL